MFASDSDNALDLVGQPAAGGVDGGEEQILGLPVVSRIKQDGSKSDPLDDLPLRRRGSLSRAVLGEFDGARMLTQVEQATELDFPAAEWVKQRPGRPMALDQVLTSGDSRSEPDGVTGGGGGSGKQSSGRTAADPER